MRRILTAALVMACISGTATSQDGLTRDESDRVKASAKFLGKTLDNEDSCKFLDLCDFSNGELWTVHAGKTVTLAGIARLSKWHNDKDEGLYAIVDIRKKSDKMQALICVANFGREQEKNALGLKAGEPAIVKGKIQRIVAGKPDVSIFLEQCQVVVVKKK